MPHIKTKVFVATLPPTPCTANMREEVLELARARNATIAEIQREAITLFLAGNISKANIDNLEAKKELEPL